jgi:hypothetical protein
MQVINVLSIFWYYLFELNKWLKSSTSRCVDRASYNYGGWFGTLLCVVLPLVTARQNAKQLVVGLSSCRLSLTMRAISCVVVRCCVVAMFTLSLCSNQRIYNNKYYISKAIGRHCDNAQHENAPFGVLH